jgi:hypothetical protein
MPKSQKRNIQKIVRATKRKLIGLIAFLSALALPLAFKWGETSWPLFLIEYRGVFLSFLMFALLATIAISPLIIEVNSNSRPLSGPGHDPRQGWRP